MRRWRADNQYAIRAAFGHAADGQHSNNLAESANNWFKSHGGVKNKSFEAGVALIVVSELVGGA
jgi:hypothetical protein